MAERRITYKREETNLVSSRVLVGGRVLFFQNGEEVHEREVPSTADTHWEMFGSPGGKLVVTATYLTDAGSKTITVVSATIKPGDAGGQGDGQAVFS